MQVNRNAIGKDILEKINKNCSAKDIKQKKMKEIYVKSCFLSIVIVVMLFSGCASNKNVISHDLAVEDAIGLQDDYILLRMYRKYAIKGAGGSFDVYLDDEKIYRAKNNSKLTIKITNEGMKTLKSMFSLKAIYAQYNDELPIDLQLGNEYYIRCGWGKMEGLTQKTTLELMDEEAGKLEFDEIPAKK